MVQRLKKLRNLLRVRVCVCVALTISVSVDGTLIEAHDVLRQSAGFITEYVLNLKESFQT